MKLKIFLLITIALHCISCTKQKPAHFTIQSQKWVPTQTGDQWIISTVINDGDMPGGPVGLTIFATDTEGRLIKTASASFCNVIILPGQTAVDTVVFRNFPLQECNFNNSLTW